MQDDATKLEVVKAVDHLSDPSYSGIAEHVLDTTLSRLCAEFAVEPDADRNHGRCNFVSNLWDAILTEAQDPETEVADWMRHGCPTGVLDSEIKSKLGMNISSLDCIEYV